MGRLTREERRRVFLAQEKARRAMQRSMACPQSTPGEPRVQRWGLLWLFRAAMIATLLAAGCFAYHAAEFMPRNRSWRPCCPGGSPGTCRGGSVAEC